MVGYLSGLTARLAPVANDPTRPFGAISLGVANTVARITNGDFQEAT